MTAQGISKRDIQILDGLTEITNLQSQLETTSRLLFFFLFSLIPLLANELRFLCFVDVQENCRRELLDKIF